MTEGPRATAAAAVEALNTIAVAEAAVKSEEAAAKTAPSCQICFEAYGGEVRGAHDRASPNFMGLASLG